MESAGPAVQPEGFRGLASRSSRGLDGAQRIRGRSVFYAVADYAGALSRLRDPRCVALCQSARAKIFCFTEIRFYRMCCPSWLTQEGRSRVVTICEPGLRWTQQRRAREVRAGRVVPVSPWPRADERCWCVRQNRVVLAVVATVKLSAEMCASPTGRTASFKFAGRGRPEGKFGSRESAA
nr:hypothetical protein BDOA9_0150740 [Bradyrhizobium sp. DOA9]